MVKIKIWTEDDEQYVGGNGWRVTVRPNGDPVVDPGIPPEDARDAAADIVGQHGDKTYVQVGQWFIVFRDDSSAAPAFHRAEPASADTSMLREVLYLRFPDGRT